MAEEGFVLGAGVLGFKVVGVWVGEEESYRSDSWMERYRRGGGVWVGISLFAGLSFDGVRLEG